MTSRFSLTSLRVRLIILVFLTFIPALTLILYTSLQYRRQAQRDAENYCLTLAKNVAHQQERIIEGGRALIDILAQVPQVQERDSAVINVVFANL